MARDELKPERADVEAAVAQYDGNSADSRRLVDRAFRVHAQARTGVDSLDGLTYAENLALVAIEAERVQRKRIRRLEKELAELETKLANIRALRKPKEKQ